MPRHLPAVGEKRYFMHKEVTIIKVWDCFQLAEIREETEQETLVVDFCTLTNQPNYANSIPLRLLGRERK